MNIQLDRNDIEGVLPHREPFLFVDAVSELEPGKRIVGELRVDDTIRFLSRRADGVFLPPTLLVEAMAQVGAIAVLYPDENRGRTIFFRSIEDTEFHERIALGQTVRFVAEARRIKARYGSMYVTANVDDTVVATGILSFALA
jgi:3-hydroxyacyl-[acyl-carrier-protein] dehydratase